MTVSAALNPRRNDTYNNGFFIGSSGILPECVLLYNEVIIRVYNSVLLYLLLPRLIQVTDRVILAFFLLISRDGHGWENLRYFFCCLPYQCWCMNVFWPVESIYPKCRTLLLFYLPSFQQIKNLSMKFTGVILY